MLKKGKYRLAAEIAEAESVTRSFVNRLLRLTLLAPDIGCSAAAFAQPGPRYVVRRERAAKSTPPDSSLGRCYLTIQIS